MGDSFNQFWFFGFVFFAAAGWFFRYIWTVVLKDNTIVQIFYIQAMVGAMRGLTHDSMDFLPAVIYSGGFLFFCRSFRQEKAAPRLG